jgi:iduronate 2-sulfatase
MPPLNVLLIGVDDLRPDLGCLGRGWAVTPHVDALASRSVVFGRAYCQVPLCGPSRASVLTGLRPDTTRIFDNSTHFRVHNPNVVTLPQHFRRNGWHTRCVGKVTHSCFERAYVGSSLDDARSWSAPTRYCRPQYYHTEEGMRVAREIFARRPDCGQSSGGLCLHCRHDVDEVLSGEGGVAWREHFVQGLLTEAPEVDDHELVDGQIADMAIAALDEMRDSRFFLAVGFMKPHTPYVAPRWCWERHRAEGLPLAANPRAPMGSPPWCLLPDQDYDNYTAVPTGRALTEKEARHLVHGYHACVTHVDRQIGRVLEHVDRLGLRERTLVVLWSDHGYHLGENGRWGKQTCLEASNHVPLLVSMPGTSQQAGCRMDPVENLDLYPTICALAGLGAPGHVEGRDLSPMIRDARARSRGFALSQFPRPVRESLPDVEVQEGDLMGYSLRTARHRLVEWRRVLSPHETIAVELYDYEHDPHETRNLAADGKQQKLLLGLRDKMEETIAR